MNKITLVLLLITMSSSGQVNFESGYFIDNKGIKTTCLIENLDWKNSPKKFTYKLSPTDVELSMSVDAAAEFQIDDYGKFIRAEVDIDRSPENIRYLTEGKAPQWSKETVFLKEIVRGKANLYVFQDGNLPKYFFSVDGKPISQLVRKQYIVFLNGDREIATNNSFRQQLRNEVSCGSQSSNDFEKIDYDFSELQNFFQSYNVCNGDNVVQTNNSKRRNGFFRVRLTPGVNFSSFEMQNPYGQFPLIEMDKTIGLRVGVELEYILPFNNNKWGLVFEPSSAAYSSEKKYVRFNNEYTATVDYKAIEFPVGVRYHMFLNDNLGGFINVLYVPAFTIDLKSVVTIDNETELDVAQNPLFAFGFGVKYDRFSLEFRYYGKKDLLNDYAFWDSELTNFGLIAGYSILDGKKRKE